MLAQRKFREADEEESYFNEGDGGADAAVFFQKPPTSSDGEASSLMEDIESLDQ